MASAAVFSYQDIDQNGTHVPLSSGRHVTAKAPLTRPQTAVTTTNEPEWLSPFLESIESLLALRPGWDSYDAPRIHRETLNNAMQVLYWAARDPATPAPWVVPTGLGGVQLEWHQPDLDIEVAFAPLEAAATLFVEDRRPGNQAEIETEMLADVTPLSQALDRLMGRLTQNQP